MMSAFSIPPAQTPTAPQLTLDCPICPRRELPSGTETCPNCATGLTPLWRVRELPSQYYNAGLSAAHSGDLDSAQRKLNCALELGGEAPELHLLLGKLCWQQGERARALKHWRQVRESAPDHAECRVLLRRATLQRSARGLLLGLLIAAIGGLSLWVQAQRYAALASSGFCAIAQAAPRP